MKADYSNWKEKQRWLEVKSSCN